MIWTQRLASDADFTSNPRGSAATGARLACPMTAIALALASPVLFGSIDAAAEEVPANVIIADDRQVPSESTATPGADPGAEGVGGVVEDGPIEGEPLPIEEPSAPGATLKGASPQPPAGAADELEGAPPSPAN